MPGSTAFETVTAGEQGSLQTENAAKAVYSLGISNGLMGSIAASLLAIMFGMTL